MTPASVLIVEDEFLIAEMLSAMVEDMGLPVCGRAASADEAVRLATLHRPGLILMDVRLKGRQDGVDAALAIHGLVPAKVVFITASREPETVARINTDHPAAVLFKPFQYDQLRQVVGRVLA